jgi:hypothetical protein
MLTGDQLISSNMCIDDLHTKSVNSETDPGFSTYEYVSPALSAHARV